MRFLIEAYRRQRQRLRLEQWLLLLVRCLVLVVLGLALAGPLMGGLTRHLGTDAAGRLVCLAIDDSLSTQTELDRGPRFETLRRQALRIIDSLGGADRVSIWRVAHPGRAELAPPTVDHERARQLLVAMKPRFSAADWTGTLSSIGAMLSQQQTPADRTTVVMLSDFSVSTLDPDRPLPPELAALGRRARLLVSRPMPDAANVQIAALSLRRQMVVAETNRPTTIAAQLRLRRFATEQPDATTGVNLTLAGEDGKPIATLRRDHHWSAGQTVAVLDVEVPVTAAWLKSTSAPRGGAAMTLTLRATIDAPGTPASTDALTADDQRVAVVELRRRLLIGILDESAASHPSEQWFHRPADWLRLALVPSEPGRPGPGGSGSTGPIEVTTIAAPLTDETSLSAVDAAMVLRPDLLAPRGWAALRVLVLRGGLAWIFVPSASNALGWPDALKQQFGLNWKLGLTPHLSAASGGSGGDGNAAWILVADAVPEPLALLGGDWPALLRPVRVLKRFDLSVSGTTGNQDAAWLRISATDIPHTTGDANTLLAGAQVGDGYILLFASALDTSWTNLPTKPLFVPLLHEILRGLLGSSGDATRLSRVTCGDQPQLGHRWGGAQEIISTTGNATPLRRSDQGLEPATPLEEPGAYAARPGAGLKLAVNVDERAGNTQALDPDALARWLRGFGNWAWIDANRPDLALVTDSPRTDLGWPLLWATMALLLMETGLARWFSHAKSS